MTGPHLCEYEQWPHSGRQPSLYVLHTLARLYETDVARLLDLADHEHLNPKDRLILTAPPATDAGHVLSGTAGHAGALTLTLPLAPGRLLIEITANADAAPARPGPAGRQLALVRDHSRAYDNQAAAPKDPA
jgi:hypothetical protein